MINRIFLYYFLISNILFAPLALAQLHPMDQFGDDSTDLNVGGDIFSDFNEELEASKIMEDERFYRYGRFFSFQVGIGFTWFGGNRGLVYRADPPSYSMGLNYFLDFNSSFGLGFAFSKNYMYFDKKTRGLYETPYFIDISLFRVQFNYRYYIETANLGTAITWSNPYFTGRLEYWYETHKYIDIDTEPNRSGGGLGMSVGFGLEFPIVIKESYLNLEFLYHTVNSHNKNTSIYQPDVNSGNTDTGIASLAGPAYSTFLSYVFNW